MYKIKSILRLLLLSVMIISFQACSVKLPLKDVKASDNSYNAINKKSGVKELSFKNGLEDSDKLLIGIFEKNVHLLYDKKDVDSFNFIKNAIVNEIQARRLPIKIMDNVKDAIKLDKFQIYTHRSSAFSPTVTFSMLKIDVEIGEQKKNFSSIIKRGKVPIWEFEEVTDPCFNEPIMLMVKEVVAKINKQYYNYKLSDEKVNEVIAKIEQGIENKDELNYLNIYELGFSNNPKVLDTLIAYSNNSDEYLRLASISMLGLIGGESQFEYLISKYRNSKLWQDRALALKAIADIDTPKAKKFIQQEYNLWKVQDTKEGKWNTMLMEVYM